MKTLMGSPSSGSNKTGYSALSKGLKAAFDPFGQAINQYTLPSNEGVISAFTPMAQTADETRAIEAIRSGFAPTEQSITSDINMQMNPYNQFVIDAINREAGGNYSLLKDALSSSGAIGSNRQILGANDIDLTRTGQIGQFLQGQYNTAMNNALTTLPQARTADAQNLLSIGDFMRNLDTLTKQAPISALQAGTGLMSPFLQGGKMSETGADSGILAKLVGIAKAASA